ncbi:hypothetical protein D0Y65_017008 [Glycine soja]|uniref:Uncharacterized protein n=1 Tax=Glycine soja TaxID=3848 RepID=A0A445JSY5_GLYSO|nr:hypothetical protein D0Y65_017008 [Glycine soja]
MIYRKWSLLTGPVAILGGVVVAIAAANVIFVKNGSFLFLMCSMCVPWGVLLVYGSQLRRVFQILSSNQRRGSMKMNLLPSRRKETTEVCVLMSFKP